MPKKLLKRWTPDPTQMHEKPGLRFLGALLKDPYLFHMNRRSVSVAFFIGVFVAFLPIPLHIPIVATAALLLRCNLPISIALIWISNPLTFPFIIFIAYKLGALILQVPPESLNIEFSWEWIKSHFLHLWEPVIVGSLLMAIFFGGLSYLLIQFLWRWHVWNRWKTRHQTRTAQRAATSNNVNQS